MGSALLAPDSLGDESGDRPVDGLERTTSFKNFDRIDTRRESKIATRDGVPASSAALAKTRVVDARCSYRNRPSL
jgi:hypothetical protein